MRESGESAYQSRVIGLLRGIHLVEPGFKGNIIMKLAYESERVFSIPSEQCARVFPVLARSPTCGFPSHSRTVLDFDSVRFLLLPVRQGGLSSRPALCRS